MPRYDDLPMPVRMVFTRKEYMWMGDEQKLSVLDDICMPDTEGED